MNITDILIIVVALAIVAYGIYYGGKKRREAKKLGGMAGCNGCSGCSAKSACPDVDDKK